MPETELQKAARAVDSLMKQMGWSQNQAAQHYGVSQTTVVRWLNARFMPRPTALRKMIKDASSHKDLLPIFESLLGKRLSQVLLEESRTASGSTWTASMSKHPDEYLDSLRIAIEERLLLVYRSAVYGDQEAVKRLAAALDVLKGVEKGS